MPPLPYRDLKPSPEAEATFRRWLNHLHEEFSRHPSPDRRAEIVRDELFQLYLGRPHAGKVSTALVSELASSALAESFDPRIRSSPSTTATSILSNTPPVNH